MARNCHLLGRLLARLRLLAEHWRRPRLTLRDYEDGLARLELLSDLANCHCPEDVRDVKARQVTDRYRARAIDAAVREGGRDE